MKLVAVVPLRDLASGKSRLRAVLPDPWRRALILAMADHTLQVLREAAIATHILVISADRQLVAHAARQPGVTGMHQETRGLNQALWEGTTWARSQGGDAVLALPPDLPALNAAALRDLVSRLPDLRPAVVVAGDRHRAGTNALLIAPPGAVPFRFGEASFTRHQAEAAARGITCVSLESPTLGFDLDTPIDLCTFAQRWPEQAVDLVRAAQAIEPTFPAQSQWRALACEVLS